MALLIAAKFSQEDMPKTFDPGPLQDLRPEEFVVVPRNGSEDVAFVAALEYKSVHQLKLRRDPYPRIIRRASEDEVESWWERKLQERRAFVLAKEKARELKMDIKISHVRFDPEDRRAIFHFTSDERVDFRALVKELSAILKMRIELWQIGVRDEARMIDGFGVCGLQTCCSTWLKEFRPITIRMAKDQDISLPPSKLSGQCGRLLCCLSYEVDQYRAMSKKALPMGSTTKYDGRDVVIIDRNLVAGTYAISDEGSVIRTVKAEELGEDGVKIPDQMKRFGKKMLEDDGEAKPEEPRESAADELKKKSKGKLRQAQRRTEMAAGEVAELPEVEKKTEPDESGGKRRRSRGGKRRRGGVKAKKEGEAPPRQKPKNAKPSKPPKADQSDKGGGGEKKGHRRKKKRRKR